jgi:hypothetical protein
MGYIYLCDEKDIYDVCVCVCVCVCGSRRRVVSVHVVYSHHPIYCIYHLLTLYYSSLITNS